MLIRLISAPPMNATVHAAIASRSAPYRGVGEYLVTTAACTIFWGWPEIVFPAQAKAGLAFGIAMGVPTGAVLWVTYRLLDAILARANRMRTQTRRNDLRRETNCNAEEKKRSVLAGFRV
jgi:amino acid permease